MKTKKDMDKITIRLSPRQLQVLDELKQKLGCNYSLLIRTMVGDFLTRNEERLERLITKKTMEEIEPELELFDELDEHANN